MARTSIYSYFDVHQGARVLIHGHFCIANQYVVNICSRGCSISLLGRLAVCGSNGRSVTTASLMPAPRRDTSSVRRCGWGAPGSMEPWCTGDEGRTWSEILRVFFSGWLGLRWFRLCFLLAIDRIDRTSMYPKRWDDDPSWSILFEGLCVSNTWMLETVKPRSVHSCFFGGSTPGLLAKRIFSDLNWKVESWSLYIDIRYIYIYTEYIYIYIYIHTISHDIHR